MIFKEMCDSVRFALRDVTARKTTKLGVEHYLNRAYAELYARLSHKMAEVAQSGVTEAPKPILRLTSVETIGTTDGVETVDYSAIREPILVEVKYTAGGDYVQAQILPIEQYKSIDENSYQAGGSKDDPAVLFVENKLYIKPTPDATVGDGVRLWGAKSNSPMFYFTGKATVTDTAPTYTFTDTTKDWLPDILINCVVRVEKCNTATVGLVGRTYWPVVDSENQNFEVSNADFPGPTAPATYEVDYVVDSSCELPIEFHSPLITLACFHALIDEGNPQLAQAHYITYETMVASLLRETLPTTVAAAAGSTTTPGAPPVKPD